jgi:hypothetical protein
MQRWSGMLMAVVLVAGAAPVSSNDGPAAGAGTLPAPPGKTAKSSNLFAKPLVLRGTLGNMTVQVNMRPKPEIDEGVEGEYFVFGQSKKILLAGEIEADEVFLEESENGTDVSGQWDGKRQGDTIQGAWLSADGSVSKPFLLKTVQTGTKPFKVNPQPVPTGMTPHIPR